MATAMLMAVIVETSYLSGTLYPSLHLSPRYSIWRVCIVAMLSHFSRVQLCATPQMAAHQAPPSTGFFRQEYCSGLPFPSPNQTQKSSKNISKPNTTMYKKNYTAQPNGICFSCARLVNIQQSIPKKSITAIYHINRLKRRKIT